MDGIEVTFKEIPGCDTLFKDLSVGSLYREKMNGGIYRKISDGDDDNTYSFDGDCITRTEGFETVVPIESKAEVWKVWP